MRLAPVPMGFAADPQAAIEKSGDSSRTTHSAVTAVDACRYLGGLIAGALRGVSKEELLQAHFSPISDYGAYRDHSRFISLLFSFEMVGKDVGSFFSDLSKVPLRTDLIRFMNEQSVALMARLKGVSITYYRTARKVRQEVDALGEPGLDLLLS